MSGLNPAQHPPGPVSTGAGFNPNAIDDAAVAAPVATPTPAPPAPAAPAAKPTAAAAAPSDPPTVGTDNRTDDGTAAAYPGAAAEDRGSDPAETDEQRAARERHQAIAAYAARRRRYAMLVTVAALAAVWFIKPWTGLTLPTNLPGLASISGAGHGPQSTSQAARPASDQVAADMAALARKLERTGDLTGARLRGADVAAAGRSAYVARQLEGQCVVYGVIDGADIVPTVDPTGQACAGQIAAVQAELDAADASRRAAAVSGAEQALTSAADTAAFYAAQNYSATGPSLRGLPPDQLAGVTVTRNHGDWAELRATVDGTCRTVIVAATGQLGEISPC